MGSSGMQSLHRKNPQENILIGFFSSGWQLPVQPALDAHALTLLLFLML